MNPAAADITITARYIPTYCHRCGLEIADLILARTPENPRRHLIKINTATVRDAAGHDYCADCWAAASDANRPAEDALVLDVATRVYPVDPTYDPDASHPAWGASRSGLPTPRQFIVRRNGKVVEGGAR